ncbi:MAG: alpha/beta fold hydrolase [Rhodobacteraceae bacterium]|nr:alpha/beta fold hydrolase [Paracoccaceae bacterium]
MENIELPLLWNGPEDARTILILAHGAGAPMDSPFMDYFAENLAAQGIRVLRFEFSYMAERRVTGKKRPPERAEKLLAAWRQVIDSLARDRDIYIGGKSMGGRMASLIADEMTAAGRISGLICLGYPFYAAGRQDRPRTEHLMGMTTRALIVQGDRDAMGNRETVTGYDLSPAIRVSWADDGNHDLVPRKRSGFTQEANWQQAIQNILQFITQAKGAESDDKL